MKNISKNIKNWAAELGFDACGIIPCREFTEDGERLKAWIGSGMNAKMGYMANNIEKRINPTLLVDATRSIIVTLTNYKVATEIGGNMIASYAQDVDYHYFIKNRLNVILEKIHQQIPESAGRAFVDSAPIFERALAVEAGLGWIGRNSMLINRELGSFTFIGVIMSNLVLDYDKPYIENHCKGCNKCVENCPTNAILANKTIDANRCISYQTIENRGEIPKDIDEKRGEWIFGCDICQRVCPHNVKSPCGIKFSEQTADIFCNITAEQLRNLTNGEFKRMFGNTPLMRAGLKKIKATIVL